MAALLPLVLAVAGYLVLPAPPSFDGAWWSSLLDRFGDLPPDILIAGAALVGLVTLGASLRFEAKGLVRLLAFLLLGETVVAAARALSNGISFAVVGWVALVWLLTAAAAVTAWFATATFNGARRVA